MTFEKPSVCHLGGTQLDKLGLGYFLEIMGSSEWTTDPCADGEKLVEVAGRVCYRSFVEGLNPNVVQVRKGNQIYLANLLKQGHHSVLEHVSDTFGIRLTRVATHELVRHRVGVAYSQESLRYVRLDKLSMYWPTAFANHPEAESLLEVFQTTAAKLENIQLELAQILDLNHLGFEEKKKLTSSMRRLAPIGLMTTIIVTANQRAWRHMIQLRTSRHAEEEIRLIFGSIFRILNSRYPSLYQDAVQEMADGLVEVRFPSAS